MKHVNSIMLAILAVVLFRAETFAQKKTDLFNPVYTGVTSLAIAPDSRAGAMGDVGVATDPYFDNNSQFWNPSKYPFTQSGAGLSLAYTPWLRKLVSDIDLANLTGFYKLDENAALSGSLTYFSLGEVIAISGQTQVIIRPYEMAVDFDYSRKLTPNFSAAVGMRFIYSDLQYKYEEDVTPGKAFSADISMFHQSYIGLGRRDCLLGLGLNASNIGSKISYDGGQTSEFLPTNLRLGMGLTVPIDEYNSISLNADANKLMVPTRPMYSQFMEEMYPDEDPSDLSYTSDYVEWLSSTGYNEMSPIAGIFKSFHDAPGGFEEELREIYWGVGLEYNYNDQFFLRGGYHFEDEFKGNRKYYTIGAGFRMNVFSLDAAYLVSTAQSNPLDQTLRFTLSFDMDGLQAILGR